ncbi:protein FAM162B [Columba livia]|nr:protein FAM162B [Columba livia]
MDLVLLAIHPTPCHKSDSDADISDAALLILLALCYETFKNDRRPTNFDKKVLVWAGRFKKEEDIPKLISSEVLDAARSSVRIKVCYIMIVLTVLGCLAMVITGKEAAKRDHTLLRMNIEKKAKWKAEVGKDEEAVVGKLQ